MNTEQNKKYSEQVRKASEYDFGSKEALRILAPEGAARLDKKVENAIALVEKKETDITTSWYTWQEIGLGLWDEYQEKGRALYHRISRFHPEYSEESCNQQYDRCRERSRGGTDIHDFLRIVEESGFPASEWVPSQEEYPSTEEDWEDDLEEEWDDEEWEKWATKKVSASRSSGKDLQKEMDAVLTESSSEDINPSPFPDNVYDHLPHFLERAIAPGTTEHEKSLLLLGSLSVLSSAFPTFSGIYDTNTRPNLYTFVCAPPASGKGILNFCKYLVMPIQKEKEASGKADREAFEKAMTDYAFSKDPNKEKPKKPADKMHFIPANNSSTGFFQQLNDNSGHGLLFENEADTVVQAMKSEYGNYSDGLRKGFHHEDITYNRRTDKEYVRIEKPCLSILLSGTPGQLASLFPGSENGLFSRFLFYYFSETPKWKDKFRHDDSFEIREYYESLGEELFKFYKKMENKSVQMVYNLDQKDYFNKYFSDKLDGYNALLPPGFLASIKRLGLSFFRITMILTALRYMEEKDTREVRECHELDFSIALRIVNTLARHSSSVFSMLPKEKVLKPMPFRKQRFIDMLKDRFARKDCLGLAEALGISERTLDRYLDELVRAEKLQRDKQGLYFKVKTMN